MELLDACRSHNRQNRKGGGVGGGKGYEASAYSYFFNRVSAQFHGQYREIYRAAVCDDILRVEAGGWRGPTHGGALDVTPYVWPRTSVEEGRRQASKEGGGRARRAP